MYTGADRREGLLEGGSSAEAGHGLGFEDERFGGTARGGGPMKMRRAEMCIAVFLAVCAGASATVLHVAACAR
ncbi:hypothetical protein AMJ39_03900 [candidate division TA06 bacterium DG_24]|uniref:Uncharacterized protein n=1 Tax=candidate division TA06 bacterium DG_24 TaxID=1703770 RepID=A0A0S7WU34_UNCT6|nr:MAG: hypothetical protein AMJ39_03900 [candidate division TA06 bacterium DG_24]